MISRVADAALSEGGMQDDGLAVEVWGDVGGGLRERPPAVLLVDDDLPDGRGADLVSELRQDPRTRHVRAIVCTGADPDRRRQISRIAPVIAKPFSPREVEDALRGAVGQRAS